MQRSAIGSTHLPPQGVRDNGSTEQEYKPMMNNFYVLVIVQKFT
jgi:hypothetical protein